VKRHLISYLLIFASYLLIFLLTGCRPWGVDPEAQRLNAQANLSRAQAEAQAVVERAAGEADAERERAGAEAYAERTRAQASLEASLAATRQMEREAAHQRWLETLTVLALVGAPTTLVLVILLLLVGRDRERQVLRLALRHAGRENRALWHGLATLQRWVQRQPERTLPTVYLLAEEPEAEGR
jgi:glutathione S-transferase